MIIKDKIQMYVEGYYLDRNEYITHVVFYELNFGIISKVRVNVPDNYNFDLLDNYLRQYISITDLLETQIFDNQKRYMYSKYDSFIENVSIIHTV